MLDVLKRERRLESTGPGRCLRRCAAGNIAVVFALALVPLTIAAGAAVDYSWATHLRTQLQSAADAAVLAGSSVSPWSEDTCRDRARQVFEGRIVEMAIRNETVPRIVCHGDGAGLAADARMSTTLLAVVGINSLGVQASSNVTCAIRTETGAGVPIAWRQTHLPDRTRVVTLGTHINGVVYYWQTPEGNPIVRIDNPAVEPTTIVIRSVPASIEGHISFSLPERGQYFVVIPWVPSGLVSFWIQEGPSPRSTGSATWNNDNNRTIATIPGTPVYAEEPARRCWLSG